MDSVEFVAFLYDELLQAGRHGEVPVHFEEAEDETFPEVCPPKPWKWTVLGDHTVWFLQICDERLPTQGRRYQFEAARNFHPWAVELDMATFDRIREFLQVLLTAMDAQKLGQYEAVTDPEWDRRGEYFNPWASRLYPSGWILDAKNTIPEDQFLASLYDHVTAHQQNKARNEANSTSIRAQDKLHPPEPRFQENWSWGLKGSREDWWLEIVDPRFPGPEYPYRIAPKGDPTFFGSGQETNLLDNIDSFIEVLITMMEEGALGQVEARSAYENGASSADPPWIRTHPIP